MLCTLNELAMRKVWTTTLPLLQHACCVALAFSAVASMTCKMQVKTFGLIRSEMFTRQVCPDTGYACC